MKRYTSERIRHFIAKRMLVAVVRMTIPKGTSPTIFILLLMMTAPTAQSQEVYFTEASWADDPLRRPLSVGLGRNAYPLLVDFDRDGDLDLLDTTFDDLLLLFERNDSSFEREIRLNAPGIFPALDDLDTDGDLDIVTYASFSATGGFYEQIAPLQFVHKTGISNPLAALGVPSDINKTLIPSFAQINGDSLNDLIILSYDYSQRKTNIHYAERSASGTFNLRTGPDNPFGQLDCGGVARCARLAFGDVDSDGDTDVVAGSVQSFGTSIRYAFRYFEQISQVIFEEKIGNENPFSAFFFGNITFSPSLGDVDDDGDTDMIAGYRDRFVLLENENGQFFWKDGPYDLLSGFSLLPDQSVLGLRFRDIDGDLDRDLVLSGPNGKFIVLERTASPTEPFSLLTEIQHLLPVIDEVAYSSVPDLIDLDGDGDDDLVGGLRDGRFFYYEQTNKGFFEKRTGVDGNPFDGLYGGPYATPTLGDVDRDGDLDMVSGDFDGIFHFFEQTSPLAFTARTGSENPFDGLNVRYCGAGSNQVAFPTFVDLNRDGHLDLMSGRCYFLNTPTGFVTTFAGSPFQTLPPREYFVATLEDLDGDGDLDLIETAIGSSITRFTTYFNTGVSYTNRDKSIQPISFELSLPVPNPSSTIAKLTLSSDRNQQLITALYDVFGRQLQILFSGIAFAGRDYEISVPVGQLASGMYLVRVQSGGAVSAQRIVVIH